MTTDQAMIAFHGLVRHCCNAANLTFVSGGLFSKLPCKWGRSPFPAIYSVNYLVNGDVHANYLVNGDVHVGDGNGVEELEHFFFADSLGDAASNASIIHVLQARLTKIPGKRMFLDATTPLYKRSCLSVRPQLSNAEYGYLFR